MIINNDENIWECRECGSSKKSSYKYICDNCYSKEWMINTKKGREWYKKNLERNRRKTKERQSSLFIKDKGFMPMGIQGFQKGHIVPKKLREKLKIHRRKKHNSKMTEFKNGHSPWNKGLTIDDERVIKSVQKRRKTIIKLIERGNYKIPKKNTSIEIKIQDFLTKIHIEFFTHKYISEITHSYQCDIFIPIQKGFPQRTIIECDGCYWHGCSICKLHNKLKDGKLKDRILSSKKRDEQRTQELIKKGFRIIRIWEHKIKGMELNNFKELIEDE